MREVIEAVLEVLARGERAALATVVRASGSTPQQPGARLLLRADGSVVGTVGGGALELDVLKDLKRVLETGDAKVVVRELGHHLGMCCGGRMEVFTEVIEGEPRLLLCGAGHVAKATAALARSIGFDVTVIDDREELLTEARFAGCRLELCDPPAALRRRELGPRDWLLIVTHDHQLDEQTLEVALERAPRYIGLIGSRRKVFRTLQRLHAKREKLDLSRVYAPVGLDVGAIGPAEIAVSIAAELVALRRGKAAPHLRAVDDVTFKALSEERPSDSE